MVTVAMTIGGLAVGCRSKESVTNRTQEDYQVVTEGAAMGVSSTIAAPGETPGLVMTETTPMTGTNVDTTTSFALPVGVSPNVAPSDGSLAGTLPGDPPPRDLPRPRATPSPRPAVVSRPEEPVARSSEPVVTQTVPTETVSAVPIESVTPPRPAEEPVEQPRAEETEEGEVVTPPETSTQS